MWGDKENFPARGYFTPQPPKRATRPPVSPLAMTLLMSERKRSLPDRFHIIHKVPPGDSPYVKAKRVQLIDKDPSKAISLFWAAINAGDRVDSALKDMAIVMKQLNRPDEAIEAIKSFRHLCPFDSQESLDNVLIELYKRSGRIEEEIEMLQHKLRLIEEGKGFSAGRTKIARSQGKKIQVTREQERSRIMGNLAWAHLQLSNYEIAAGFYREALFLEPDKNKQCNLAICLMHMNRIAEARAVLDAVKHSCNDSGMDESYAKSFDRALQMLTEIEFLSIKHHEEGNDKEIHRPSASLEGKDSRESTLFSERIINRGARSLASTIIANGHGDETWILNERNGVLSRGDAQSSSETIRSDNWREVSQFETPQRYVSSGNLHDKENSLEKNKVGWSSSSRSISASPASVKRTMGFSPCESRRHTCRSLYGSTASCRESESKSKATLTGETKTIGNCSVAKAKLRNYDENMVHNIVVGASSEGYPEKLVETSTNDIKDTGGKSFWVDKHKKSWADMAEEEEQDLTNPPPVHLWDNSPQKPSPYKTPTRSFHSPNYGGKEGFNDENVDINIVGQFSHGRTLMENLSRTLTLSDVECGSKLQTIDISSRTPGRSAVRRSLNFNQTQEQELDSVMLSESEKADDGSLQGNNWVSDAVPAKKVGQATRKRLQVFQDITCPRN